MAFIQSGPGNNSLFFIQFLSYDKTLMGRKPAVWSWHWHWHISLSPLPASLCQPEWVQFKVAVLSYKSCMDSCRNMSDHLTASLTCLAIIQFALLSKLPTRLLCLLFDTVNAQNILGFIRDIW